VTETTSDPAAPLVPATSAPHQAIYRRWRSQTFAQVVGQEAVVETLRNAVRTGRVAHAILFVGPRGTGKTSLARILAKAINCTDLRDGDACDRCPSCTAIREGRAMDLVEIDAASNRGIDAIRELRERINYAPTDLRRKVYILDEAHQITRDAWNALLKSLEEPPDFVVFMFASTHPQEFPPAILSRLQRFDVRRLTTAEIEGKLRRILVADGHAATPEAVHLIARLAAGGMRDAEAMLDQLLASSAEELDEARVRDLMGLADAETVEAFTRALAAGDAAAGIRTLDGLEERGRDLRTFLDQVIDVLRAGIVSQGAGPAGLPVPAIASIARRLASIDPSRSGVGGLRLQLELALLPPEAAVGEAHWRPAPVVPVPAPVGPARDPEFVTGPEDQPAPGLSAGTSTGVRPLKPPTARRRHAPSQPSDSAPSTPAAIAFSHPDPATTSDGGRSAPAGPPVTGELATLHARWGDVVARISSHPPTKPLIVACRPISVEDDVVTLGFPEDKGFLRDVAERRRAVLEEGISEVLGHSVAVRCVATNLDLLPDLPTDDEAAWLLAEAKRIFGEDAVEPGEVG
jgi:DNA polymerase III subunit gamma/tau